VPKAVSMMVSRWLVMRSDFSEMKRINLSLALDEATTGMAQVYFPHEASQREGAHDILLFELVQLYRFFQCQTQVA
jgi:hypothetical protein